jgi:hypothetical protein
LEYVPPPLAQKFVEFMGYVYVQHFIALVMPPFSSISGRSFTLNPSPRGRRCFVSCLDAAASAVVEPIAPEMKTVSDNVLSEPLEDYSTATSKHVPKVVDTPPRLCPLLTLSLSVSSLHKMIRVMPNGPH